MARTIKTIYTKSIVRYTTVNATIESAEAVCDLYNRNIDALHGSSIPLDEWKNLLSVGDPDEEHFLIHKGAIPAAWLKINGLQDRDMAWISMLAVEPSMQRSGFGTYAVQFAENYIRLKGLSKVGIHTTGDNIPAQNLYCKCGYTVTEIKTGACAEQTVYTFEKQVRFAEEESTRSVCSQK